MSKTKFLTGSDAIYQGIRNNGIGHYRPYSNDDHSYAFNIDHQRVEIQQANASVLPLDTWKKLDGDISSVIRTELSVFSDIMSVGTVDLGSRDEALGTTLYIDEKYSDSGDTDLSMTGRSKISNDVPLVSNEILPLPMINSDFRIDIRTLNSSARGAYGMGSNVSIDSRQAENSARKTAEKLEDLAIIGGGTFKFAGVQVYGMTTAPNRVTTTYAKEWSDVTKTFDECVADVREWINLHFLQGTGGEKSLMLYIPSAWNVALSLERGTDSSINLRDFLMAAFPELIGIKSLFRMTVNSVCLLEMRPRTVKVINGFAPTAINWMSPDGLEFNWKLLTLQIPKFYSDYNGVMGLVHATKA